MRSVLSLAALFVLGSVAACASEPEESSPVSPCAIDDTIRPKRIAVNGVQLNGIQLNGVQVNGVQINGIQSNGMQINGTSLAGLKVDGATATGVLTDGRTIALSLGAREIDPAHPDVVLYELTHEGTNLCEGGGKGLLVPGVWDATGAHHESSELQTFACTSGVIAKCVMWGYAPSRVGSDAHQACTRMARADYCGNGVSYTREGTAIDVFHAPGMQSDASFLFEAGWNANGAVCVSRTRYAGPQPSCLRDLPKCSSLEEAKALGATIANGSRPQSRALCE